MKLDLVISIHTFYISRINPEQQRPLNTDGSARRDSNAEQVNIMTNFNLFSQMIQNCFYFHSKFLITRKSPKSFRLKQPAKTGGEKVTTSIPQM